MKTTKETLLLIATFFSFFCTILVLLYQSHCMYNGNFRKRFKTLQLHEQPLNITTTTRVEIQSEAGLGTKVLDAHDNQNNENAINMKDISSDVAAIDQEIRVQKPLTQQKQTTGTEFYKHVNLVNTVASSLTWQPVVPHDSYVYSAYIDDRINGTAVTLITIEDGYRKQNFMSYCHLWFKNESLPVVIEAEIVYWLGSGYR